MYVLSDINSKSVEPNRHYGIQTNNRNVTQCAKQEQAKGGRATGALEEWQPIKKGTREEGRQEGTLKVFQCLIFK